MKITKISYKKLSKNKKINSHKIKNNYPSIVLFHNKINSFKTILFNHKISLCIKI